MNHLQESPASQHKNSKNKSHATVPALGTAILIVSMAQLERRKMEI
jgi:hypothetical protein